MKIINDTVVKMSFPFAATLIYDKGFNREKIFHSEFKFYSKQKCFTQSCFRLTLNSMYIINDTA